MKPVFETANIIAQKQSWYLPIIIIDYIFNSDDPQAYITWMPNNFNQQEAEGTSFNPKWHCNSSERQRTCKTVTSIQGYIYGTGTSKVNFQNCILGIMFSPLFSTLNFLMANVLWQRIWYKSCLIHYSNTYESMLGGKNDAFKNVKNAHQRRNHSFVNIVIIPWVSDMFCGFDQLFSYSFMLLITCNSRYDQRYWGQMTTGNQHEQAT